MCFLHFRFPIVATDVEIKAQKDTNQFVKLSLLFRTTGKSTLKLEAKKLTRVSMSSIRKF